ncbi:MAG: ABC transporter permease, partial [Flavisolibacter sp.]|nr:ABC transporter permease [Flavisolibacter sp.]
MKTIPILLRKEFKQIFRNKSILAMIIAMPVIQLVLLPLAANYEVKNINLAVVDEDRSTTTRRLISGITASGYFNLTSYETSFPRAFENIETDKADIVLQIPKDFEKKLVREGRQKVLIAVNAINGVKANLGSSYLTSILRNFNREIQVKFLPSQEVNFRSGLSVTSSNWFNPFLNYRLYMVPGILAVLVTMVGCFLTALNIVKEKEAGTIEQINVTPIQKHHFILGKLIPFWILGMVVFSIGLLVAWLIYGIVSQGSLLLLLGFIAVYLPAVLGLGFLVSTFCQTQQQAMLVMFFFMMIFVLLGGL